MTSLASNSFLRTAWSATTTATYRVPSSSAAACTTLAPRHLHTSPISRSHIGSMPLPIPSGVSLTLPSDLSLPPTLLNSSSRSKRSISISGPLGAQNLSIPPCAIIDPPTSSNGNVITLSVRNSEEKEQKSLWGLTRALLANAVRGVSEGYRVTLRLVGVGYRGAVEPIPESLRKVMQLNYGRVNASGEVRELPTERLNMKLGYAHPIYVDIPAGITVTTPQPTRIVLQGTDKQKLGLFAEKIRRWRKPEPYRGKGIFVGDETIKIKEIKKK